MMQVDSVRGEIRQADKVVTSKLHEVEDEAAKKLKDTYKETSKELQQTADNFDKTVTRKTVEAKTGIASWLGFGK